MKPIADQARFLIDAIEENDRASLDNQIVREAFDDLKASVYPEPPIEQLETVGNVRPPMRDDQVMIVPASHRASWCRG